MAQDTVPDDFDWVGAQSKCSAATMFERMRARVRDDVQRRNAILDRGDGWTFEFYDEDDLFEVSRAVASGRGEPNVTAVVRFERAGRRIEVQGEDIDVQITAVVTLDVTGACRLVVGEAVYSDWEIRRMALELLFFEELEEDSE